MVVWENRFLGIRDALFKEDYTTGNVDYVTSHSLQGQDRTLEDDVHWAQLRYVAIPLILVRDTLDTRYVIGDFTGAGAIPDIPQNLVKIYDTGDGLILFKRELRQ